MRVLSSVQSRLHESGLPWKITADADPQAIDCSRLLYPPSSPASILARRKSLRHNRKCHSGQTLFLVHTSLSPQPRKQKTRSDPTQVSAGVKEASGTIDFAYVRSQITIQRVLRHLGYFDRLRGKGQQRRGACPIHGTKRARGRTFSVHLGKGVFQCFHPPCGAAGNVLDLLSAAHGLTPYEAARHLADTFDLHLTRNTEKRNP